MKTKKQKKCKKRKTLSDVDVMEARRKEGAGLVPKQEVGVLVKFASEDGKE